MDYIIGGIVGVIAGAAAMFVYYKDVRAQLQRTKDQIASAADAVKKGVQ